MWMEISSLAGLSLHYQAVCHLELHLHHSFPEDLLEYLRLNFVHVPAALRKLQAFNSPVLVARASTQKELGDQIAHQLVHSSYVLLLYSIPTTPVSVETL